MTRLDPSAALARLGIEQGKGARTIFWFWLFVVGMVGAMVFVGRLA